MFQGFALLGAYINAKQRNVSKMKEPHNVCFLTLIQIVYQKYKVYYFSNINVISIVTTNQGKPVDWLDTVYKQLHSKLTRWRTSQTRMLRGIMKVDAKKDICHSTLVTKMLIQYFLFESNPQILVVLKPTKGQQTSTSKANASRLKDMLQKTKCPSRPSIRSPRMILKLERQRQMTIQQNMFNSNEV